MANNKQVGSPLSSSPDILNELFGTKQRPDSLESFFDDLLSQNNSASSAEMLIIPTYSSGSLVWNPEQEYVPKDIKADEKEKESVFQERSEHPLCSSIYYGSQEDIPASYFTLDKEENKRGIEGISSKEVDSTIDWWKGSFYY